MAWKRISVPRDGTETRVWKELQDNFEVLFLAVGGPRDAAMFTNRKLADEQTFYFSPRAAEIFSVTLQRFAADDCERPLSSEVSLLVGHDAARDVESL